MFENEQSLVDAGFVLTPNVFHSGLGSGKVYGKSFANGEPFTDANVEGGFHYDYYSVDPNGVVASYKINADAEVPVAAPTEAEVVAEEVKENEAEKPEEVAATEVVAEPVAEADPVTE